MTVGGDHAQQVVETRRATETSRAGALLAEGPRPRRARSRWKEPGALRFGSRCASFRLQSWLTASETAASAVAAKRLLMTAATIVATEPTRNMTN